MFDNINAPSTLRPQELEAVYAISRAVGQAEDIENALDEIIRLSRAVLIFDNMVVYLLKADALEPTFARIIGRGRTAEAEISWGESTAMKAVTQQHVCIQQEKLDGWEQERLAWRNFLGLPLISQEEKLGALVFGRFGGPAYAPDQIHLAEYIASHIAQLLGRQNLVARIASLEAERRLGMLQSDFIAMVSHELCTPLGFIKGYATTLLRQDAHWDEASRKEFLQIIDEEADRLRELIDSLLDSSRLQAGTLHMTFQQVRLDTLLREIASRASSRFDQLSVNLALRSNVHIQADPTRLAQVFDNLLSNAVKYAPGAPVEIGSETAADRAHIVVKDAGPGISPEHLSQLFKRFYRVPETRAIARGTGLGLFICRQIITAHAGEISVESVIGQGTSFHIYLPLKQPKSETNSG